MPTYRMNQGLLVRKIMPAVNVKRIRDAAHVSECVLCFDRESSTIQGTATTETIRNPTAIRRAAPLRPRSAAQQSRAKRGTEETPPSGEITERQAGPQKNGGRPTDLPGSNPQQ